jgi:hypothetical protein
VGLQLLEKLPGADFQSGMFAERRLKTGCRAKARRYEKHYFCPRIALKSSHAERTWAGAAL